MDDCLPVRRKDRGTFYNFRELIPPRDRFWADPFPFKVGTNSYIFAEELFYKRGIGHIAILPVNQQGLTGSPIKILERPYHLSYPFVFEWQSELYMMPETAHNKSLEVYRCDQFPDKWSHYRTIMENTAAADATLHFHNGLWWLFVNIGSSGCSKNDELFLFHSESPLGPWRPHRNNPVKSDVRSARPAGRLFERQGKLYRPAQDLSCAPHYTVPINRVDALGPERYEERVVSCLRAGWRKNQIGIHTLNHYAGISVIDVMLRRWRYLG